MFFCPHHECQFDVVLDPTDAHCKDEKSHFVLMVLCPTDENSTGLEQFEVSKWQNVVSILVP